MSKRRKPRRRGGRTYVGVIIIFLVVVMAFQITSLYRKNAAYEQQEAHLQEELEEQQAAAEDLKTYEERTKTDEYVENTARGKLGLVHDNEIVFRESDDE
ncbi:MAG: septum formation initiator family protein [Lachnospiraceae bacterium]|nr:septum formation initiator family protein [Lachnospiraceae bacterium]